MFYPAKFGEKYQDKHLSFLFWTREYRRQSAYKYFFEDPIRLKKYISSLKKILHDIHLLYSKNFELYRNKVIAYHKVKEGIEEEFIVALEKKIKINELKKFLNNPAVCEFLLEELTGVVYNALKNKVKFLKVPDRYIKLELPLFQLTCFLMEDEREKKEEIRKELSKNIKFNPAPYKQFLKFHTLFGVFPLDLDVSCWNKEFFLDNSYYKHLIRQGKMRTDLKRVILEGLAETDKLLASNSLLLDFSKEYEDISYSIGAENFEIENRKSYNYIYINENCLFSCNEVCVEKNKLFFTCLEKKMGRPTNKKNSCKNINTTRCENSYAQIKVSTKIESKNLLNFIEIIFAKMKNIKKFKFIDSINANRLYYNDQPIKNNYQFLRDSKEESRIKAYINPENIKERELSGKIPSISSDKNNEKELEVAIQINETLLDAYSLPSEKIHNITSASYTPKVHKDINEARSHMVLCSMEKSQISDSYRAAGIYHHIKCEFFGKSYGQIEQEIADMSNINKKFSLYDKFDNHQIWECITLARLSIELKKVIKKNEAITINKNNPKKDRYKAYLNSKKYEIIEGIKH